MKTLLFAAALIAVTSGSIGAALAAGPRPSGGGFPSVATAPSVTPHYEWQFGYVGHHPRYEGRWVLVR